MGGLDTRPLKDVIAEITKDVVQRPTTAALLDPSLTCQVCGCDPGYRGQVGWSILTGHHCSHYPNCAWGKTEQAQQIGSGGVSGVTIKHIVPGYPEKFGTLPQGLIPKQPVPYSNKSVKVGIGGAPTRPATPLGGTSADRDAHGNKRCPKCSVFTPIAGYHRSNQRAGWLSEDGTYRQSYCKSCQAKDRIAQGRKRVAELGVIKTTQGCGDCGFNTHPEALDFHHVEDKTFSISAAACSGASLARLKQEIAQCIVLCANCHRIRHAADRS